MKLTGDIRKIGTKRDSKHQDIVLTIDRVEYLTHKKDGHYFQAFDYEDELETPIVLTGDRLARKNQKAFVEGEFEYYVYDLVEGEYVRNDNVVLEVAVAYNPDEDLLILSAGYYGVTLPPKEFDALKKEREKIKGFRQRVGKKKR